MAVIEQLNAIIFHGPGETPNSFWYPYVRRGLEERGYSVWVPQLPDTDNPDIAKWLPLVLEQGKFTERTVLIGHSAGAPLILSVLERTEVEIRQAILVAGFSSALPSGKPPILQDNYDWNGIRQHAKKFVFINSDNDPWGCDDKQGRVMFDHLGGMLIIKHGDGHMGSNTYNQPYKEFPLLLQLID